MKRIIAVMLAAVLLLSMIPFASAEAGMENFQKVQTKTYEQFSDVKSSDWYAPGVQFAYELGLMLGVGSGKFAPNGVMSVSAAVAIACRIHSIYADNGEQFAVVGRQFWYAPYMSYAETNKIIAAGQLQPNETITREQFASVMCAALPESELEVINNVTKIPDVPEDAPYAESIYRLYNAGVMTGSDKFGTFMPKSSLRRSEVATIAIRMADKSQRKTVVLEELTEVAEIELVGKTQINVGESTAWAANVLPDGSPTKLTWRAGNPAVATVDQNGNVKGLKSGQCNITVTAANGVNKTVLLTVNEVAVSDIQLAGKTQINVGESTKWSASVLPDNASNKKITWTAGNPAVATVDQNGNIKGLKAGQCHITATAANGIKKTVMVSVTKNGFEEIKNHLLEYGYKNIHTSIKNPEISYEFTVYDESDNSIILIYNSFKDTIHLKTSELFPEELSKYFASSKVLIELANGSNTAKINVTLTRLQGNTNLWEHTKVVKKSDISRNYAISLNDDTIPQRLQEAVDKYVTQKIHFILNTANRYLSSADTANISVRDLGFINYSG